MSTALTARRARTRLCGALLAVCLGVGVSSSTACAIDFEARLTPNLLGAPANLSSTLSLVVGNGVPPPVSSLVGYGPAGLRLDLRGVAVCERASLERDGPRSCPPKSRVGFGGGVAAFELGSGTVRAPFSIDLFLGPREHARLTLLIYVSANDPIPIQLVLLATETRGSSPFGVGFAVNVPPIATFPDAPNVSVESTYLSLGASNVAYYETVEGDRKLVPVRGLIAPKACPRGGLSFRVLVAFEDGTKSAAEDVAPCPRVRR